MTYLHYVKNVELALGRTALVTVAVVLALAPLPVRSQAVEGVGGVYLFGLSSREQSRSSDRSHSWCVRSGSRGDRFRRDRSWSSDCYQSRRQRARSPAHREARGHTILHVALVTARGLVGDHLPPLTVRGLQREDGEPDVSDRRVWRR